jgi:hypothetical protein
VTPIDDRATALPDESSLSSVELQRRQRKTKRFVVGAWFFAMVGPFALGVAGLAIALLGKGAGWTVMGGFLLLLAGLFWPLAIVVALVLGVRAFIRHRRNRSASGDAETVSPGTPAPPPSTLAADLAPLEELRVRLAARMRKRTRIFVPLGIGIGLVAGLLLHSFVGTVLTVGMGAIGGWAWAICGPREEYRRAFKDKLIPLLLPAHGDLRYSVGEKPDLSRAVTFGLLPAYDGLTADDGFTGRYRDYPIVISEIEITRQVASGSMDNRRTRDMSLFKGLYVEIGVAIPFVGITMLRDREAPQPRIHLQRLHLEDPVFEEVYAAWSSDQVEGRAVLTPAVMERLLVMGDGKSFQPPMFLIGGDAMIFALPTDFAGELFEPPDLQNKNAAEQVASLEADFARVFGLIDAMIAMHAAIRTPDTTVSSPLHSERHPMP